MPLHRIYSLDDARLAPYRNLKDNELARLGGRFIAEGEQVTRRLLASSIPVESLLVAERKAAEILPIIPEHLSMWVAPDSVLKSIIGFAFHSGVMAVGIRPASPSLEAALPMDRTRLTALICPEIANTDNLGAIIRVAAAFGADAMILGERCCDPFFRHSVRVSMGSVFRLPIVRSDDLSRDLARLRNEWRMELAATVLADDAEPLAAARRKPRLGIVLGNEAQGLDENTVSLCDRKMTIPMRLGTDSLNVAVAAGIVMYHFTDVASMRE